MATFKSEKEMMEYAMFADLSKVKKVYQPSEEELKIIIEQTSCSEEQAKEFFNKNKGDLENTIFDFLESNNELVKLDKPNIVSEEDLLNDNISTLDKMDTYRDILYHKDKVFQQKFDETSNFDNRVMGSFDCVAFTPETKEYRKLKFKCSKDYFTMDILRSYIEREINDSELYELSENNKAGKQKKNSHGVELDRKIEVEITRENDGKVGEDNVENSEEKEGEKTEKSVDNVENVENDSKENDIKKEECQKTPEEQKNNEEKKEELEEVKSPERKLVIKTIVKKGLEMSRKWGFKKPILAYIDYTDTNNIEPEKIKEENVNKLATKFMKNCGYFTENENIYGPVMIIDNWFI